MFGSLGLEELLLVAVLGFLLFSPREIARALRNLRVASTTLRSWVEGMWKGL